MKGIICHLVRILVFAVGGLAGYSVTAQTHLPDNFAKADSLAACYPNYSLTNLKALADKLTAPLNTEKEKFRAIFKWVCNNIETDYDFYVKSTTKRRQLQNQPEKLEQWNAKSNRYFFQKLLKEHKTICTGYAYLLKELAFHAGINCRIIDGYGRTPQANVGGNGIANHSWNAVQLNQQWYLADATWSAGAVDPMQQKFIRQFSDTYFLTPAEAFALTHYPLDSAWLLLPHKPTLTHFLNGPIAYKGAVEYNVLPVYPENFRLTTTRGQEISFRFKQQADQPIEKVELQLVEGSHITSFYPTAYTNANGTTTIKHVFSQKGSFTVHLRVEDAYIFTYSVAVTR